MTNGMAHEEARDALEALALDALDAGERGAVLSHVASCPICRAEVASLQAAAAELSYAVAPVPLSSSESDRLRSRLVGRAAADRAPAPEQHVPPSFHLLVPHAPTDRPHMPRHERMRDAAPWIAMAASVVAIVSVTMLLQVMRQRDTLANAYQLASVRMAVVDSLRASVEDRNRLIANLTGPQVTVVTLTSAGVRAPTARMFWDQAANAWTFVAHNLPAPKQGRTYQLWLVTANAKISAGTFMPTASGDAIVRATYSLPKDGLAAVAVTDEPEAGSPQPTTVPVIVGVNSTR